MSRVAKETIIIPVDVEVLIKKQNIFIKGKKGILEKKIHPFVNIKKTQNKLIFFPNINIKKAWAQAGTVRSLVFSMILGVQTGFEKKLKVIGIGYRVSINENKIINLCVGLSHSINYKIPKDIFVECPSQNEIIIKGIDKQLVNQVTANIRFYRKPDPYKGKGIRYENEIVRTKEAKKK